MRYIVSFKNEMTHDVVSLCVSFDNEHEPREVLISASRMLRAVADENFFFYSLVSVESI